eukprot:TRINITY_DN339_c0_g2_i3.p2 TRINITY_DN339_c0_g2~~TRINITY_DN339_c0_g2_i3.p2  ORF type:complete len:219 (-),score=51.07 TRINITY_DN339_c0_g2_i3:843-1499(-)
MKSNLAAPYKIAFRPFPHKSSLTVHSPEAFELPAARLRNSIMRRVSSSLLDKDAVCPAPMFEPEYDVIGNEYSDPPSILHIESEIEEEKELPAEPIKEESHENCEVSTPECRPTGVTKSAEGEQTGHITRVLSTQLKCHGNEDASWHVQRSYSAKLQRVEIDELIQSSDSYKDYLCTLFGSLCLLKEIDPRVKDFAPASDPANRLALKRPAGLLCTLL